MGGGRGSFLSLGNQPTVDSWRRAVPVSPWCSGNISSLCPLGQVAHPLPESSSLASTENSMWFLGLPHQAAGHSQPGSSISGQRLRVSCFRCAGPLWVWIVSHGRHFFHWNELAQSWAGKSNPPGLCLYTWLGFPPPPPSRCLGEATKA